MVLGTYQSMFQTGRGMDYGQHWHGRVSKTPGMTAAAFDSKDSRAVRPGRKQSLVIPQGSGSKAERKDNMAVQIVFEYMLSTIG